MKKLFALIGLMALTASAQLALNNAPFAALLSRQGSASGEPFFEEFFEAPGYENTWVTNNPGASINPENASAPLQGTFSLSINLTSDGTSVRSVFASQTTVDVFFLVRFSNMPGTSLDEDWFALNDGSTKVVSVFLNVGNVVSIKAPSDTAVSTVGTMSVNTTYFCWLSYQAGSGANGRYSFAFSTTSTRPTSGNNFIETTTSASTASVDTIRLGADASPGTDTWTARYDACVISASTIPVPPFE